jgi:hypothetical protein
MNGSTKLEKLVRLFSEVVDDGALSGNWNDCTLCVDAELLPLWKEIAPNTPVAPFGPRKPAGTCIVFDAGEEAITLRRCWAKTDPKEVLSFFHDYYPATCARTFQPGVVAEQIGQGLVMFQTPRTGSHFMQGMLSQLKEFGVAAEWIRPPLIEAHALGIVSVAEHLRQCARHQRAFHAYWAASIVLPFLETLMDKMSPDDRADTVDFLSRGHLFLTMRKSRTAQTWSQIRAKHSGVFHIKTADRANSELDSSMQPVEKFWFWNLLSGFKINVLESLARNIAAQVGKQVAEVPYEEMRNHVFLLKLEPQIFGPLYDPIRHRLDPYQSTYSKQSTSEDATIVAQLELILHSTREIDFRHRTGLENITFHGATAGFRWVDAGLDVSSGRLSFILWPTREQRTSTIAIQFTAAAGEGSHVEITVHRANRELAKVTVCNKGSYCLFLDGGIISAPDTVYAFSVLGEGAQAVLVSIHECFVPFATPPEFPWMRVIQHDELFLLCEFVVTA